MKIETERIIIRELLLEDSLAYIEMASDGSLSDIFGDCTECDKWMSEWINDSRELYKSNDPYNDYLAYAIVEKNSNHIIGSIGCSAYKDLNEIGITYFIGSAYRRKGYATEAARAYSDYFLKQYKNVLRMIATVRTENISSCKTVEKSGFLLQETKMYKDINDTDTKEYNFYFITQK